jgi:hypothetical protein
MNILDVKTNLMPAVATDYADFFIKIDSDVTSSTNEFYHDSNGYLVSKRKLNSRPDY